MNSLSFWFTEQFRWDWDICDYWTFYMLQELYSSRKSNWDCRNVDWEGVAARLGRGGCFKIDCKPFKLFLLTSDHCWCESGREAFELQPSILAMGVNLWPFHSRFPEPLMINSYRAMLVSTNKNFWELPRCDYENPDILFDKQWATISLIELFLCKLAWKLFCLHNNEFCVERHPFSFLQSKIHLKSAFRCSEYISA